MREQIMCQKPHPVVETYDSEKKGGDATDASTNR